jgi:hypothetical protein
VIFTRYQAQRPTGYLSFAPFPFSAKDVMTQAMKECDKRRKMTNLNSEGSYILEEKKPCQSIDNKDRKSGIIKGAQQEQGVYLLGIDKKKKDELH